MIAPSGKTGTKKVKEMFDPTVPYNDLPLLPPKSEVETKAVLKQAIAATRALAELKGAGDLLPNQSILINSIPLQEAKASSEIENIVTTEDKLYKAAASELEADPATKEVLRYRTALKTGYEHLEHRPLSTNTVIEICSILHGRDMDVRKIPGTVIANPVTKDVIYTPPTGEQVIREKLANLEQFIHDGSGLDPLVRMAIAHYQFEAIHPFHDGNGRTGRILNILFLVEKGLLKIPVLYLSRFIIENKNDYYRLLNAVTASGEWEPWILYMLKAVEETAISTCEKVHAVCELLERTRHKVKAELPGLYSRELIDVIFTQPYCKIGFFLNEGLVTTRKTASLHLRKLVEIGVLERFEAGREVIFLNPELLEVLKR